MIVLTQGTNTLSLSLGIVPRDLDLSSYTWEIVLTSEATRESKAVQLQTISWNDRVFTGTIFINDGAENLASGIVKLESPEYPAGFYEVLVRADDGVGDTLLTHMTCYAHLSRVTGEEGYREIKDYTIPQTYKAYEQ